MSILEEEFWPAPFLPKITIRVENFLPLQLLPIRKGVSQYAHIFRHQHRRAYMGEQNTAGEFRICRDKCNSPLQQYPDFSFLASIVASS
jgi:hypothetical protein